MLNNIWVNSPSTPKQTSTSRRALPSHELMTRSSAMTSASASASNTSTNASARVVAWTYSSLSGHAAAISSRDSLSHLTQMKQGCAQSQAKVDRLKQELSAALATSKEDAEKLMMIVQRQTQLLEHAIQARAQMHAEVEVLDIMRVAQKKEIDTVRVRMHEHERRVEYLAADRERVRKERDALRNSLNAEIGQFKLMLEKAYADRTQAHTELCEVKKSLEQRVEHLTTDRERVRKEREALRANLEQLELTQQKETKQFKAALEEVNADRTQAHTELNKARESLDACAPKLENSLREIHSLRRELWSSRESSRAVADLEQRLAVQSGELRAAREESSALKKEFSQLVTLLKDRTSVLKGAPSFLTTEDAFSGVEATNTLQRLNEEVLQSSAFIADLMVGQFLHEVEPQASKTDEQLAACKRASAAIGGSIVHFLGTKKHRDNPILIQIAFQAYLTYHLCWITCPCIIGEEEDDRLFVNAIHQSLHGEVQEIAGRWRALTRAHIPSTPLDDAQLSYQISTEMISGLSDILLTTGCTAPKSDVSMALTSKFSDKLLISISMAIRVNKIVGGNVAGFEVVAVPPGTAFDAETMRTSASKGREGNVPLTRVLCATDLGLRKRTRVVAETGEREGQWETKLLLKPKVALESLVDILGD